MATIEQNKGIWSTYDWTHFGDEWSGCWGGTDYLFWGTVFPRIHPFFPRHTVLEIAPGHGRITQYIKTMCHKLIGVDLVEACVEACRNRFALDEHVEFHGNDGSSLPMIADQSIDFIFSWDSLVHCEADVLQAYAAEFARVLKPGGAGFIHHSNLGAYVDPETGVLDEKAVDKDARAESASAERFRADCQAAGIKVVSQELINWGSSQVLNDVFSYFERAEDAPAGDLNLIENPDFMQEAARQLARARLYQPRRFQEPTE